MLRSTMTLILLNLGLLATTATAGDTPVTWKRIKVDEAFRSEGVAAFDVNHDGKIDIVNGEMWYEAPDWIRHEIRTLGKYVPESGYSKSFINFGYDVNGDGWTDLICIGFPGAPFHWFENPKNQAGMWKQHEIWHSACNETPQFADITGDGRPEIILATQPEAQIGYLEIPEPSKATQPWTFRAVCPKGTKIGTEKYYHGLGTGDFNNDGLVDVIIPDGYWEHPVDLNAPTWTFHPFKLPKPNPAKNYGPLAADVYVDDLDLDGDNDLLMSSAHRTGVWWFENVGTNADPKFVGHVISEALSQTHALHYVDVNGDGTRDLVTGKRFYAHGPKGDDDPQAEVTMYWFEIHKGNRQPPQFIPHKITEGTDTGVGTQFFVGDMNSDGQLDIVLSNKKGTNLLLQTRPSVKAGQRH